MNSPLACSKVLQTGHCGSSQISIVFAAPLLNVIPAPFASSTVETTVGPGLKSLKIANDSLALDFSPTTLKIAPDATTRVTIPITNHRVNLSPPDDLVAFACFAITAPRYFEVVFQCSNVRMGKSIDKPRLKPNLNRAEFP